MSAHGMATTARHNELMIDPDKCTIIFLYSTWYRMLVPCERQISVRSGSWLWIKRNIQFLAEHEIRK